MDAAQVWRAALERLRAQTTPGAFSAWFSRSEGVALAHGTLTVAVRTTFAREHLRLRFADQVRTAASEALGRRVDVAFVVGGQADERKPASSAMARPIRIRASMAQQVAVERRPRAGTGKRAEAMQPALLTVPEQDTAPRLTFENFVVGSGNLFAYAAAKEVARALGTAYNPLFVYGGAGLGKTHLLRALAYEAQAAGRSVAYVCAGDFAAEVVAAVQRGERAALRARYRSVDLLLVDDAQAIAGGEVVEEELLHTFDALHEAGRQIVLSSDRIPRGLRHLHAQLRSRFEWGLIVDLHAPDYDHRQAILRAKAAALGLSLRDDALRALAQPEYESVRALEKALQRVLATARLLNRAVDADLVREELRDLAMGVTPRLLDGAAVMDAVLRHYHLTRDELCGAGREHRLALARQVTMYLLRTETAASFGAIGWLLGGRDHSTVMHGCERVGGALARDAHLRAEVMAIRAQLAQ